MTKSITLKDMSKPAREGVTADLDWICECFGLVSGRDTKKVSSRLIRSLVQNIAKKGYATVQDIAKDTKLSRQKVNYHLRGLMLSGFIVKDRRRVMLRENSILGTIQEMRKDSERIFDKLSEIATEIDNELGLKSR
ncbi:MAG TPA: winged helix-turn-helix transcriptional regulator [Candidatus Woesearchaeota archaeon]|jgi:predicted transcriptional regulator|nr:winged helix-turn-helix transcriptional regulator [Candidatus Woesearchaeota archaeon]